METSSLSSPSLLGSPLTLRRLPLNAQVPTSMLGGGASPQVDETAVTSSLSFACQTARARREERSNANRYGVAAGSALLCHLTPCADCFEDAGGLFTRPRRKVLACRLPSSPFLLSALNLHRPSRECSTVLLLSSHTQTHTRRPLSYAPLYFDVRSERHRETVQKPSRIRRMKEIGRDAKLGGGIRALGRGWGILDADRLDTEPLFSPVSRKTCDALKDLKTRRRMKHTCPCPRRLFLSRCHHACQSAQPGMSLRN